MQRVAIFDYYLGGHHLEYLHHLYYGALERTNVNFLFIVPSSFPKFASRLNWKESDNISFLYFDCDEVQMRQMNIYMKAFYLSIKLASVIRKENLEHVILLETMVYMPFLPLFVPTKVKLTSIIYLISIFRTNPSFLTNCSDYFKYWLISTFKCFHKVFLLNDKRSKDYYNKKYNVTKYSYLPDPYFPIKFSDNANLREQYSIDSKKQILLHFGGMTRRKGTIEILKAFELLDTTIQNKYCIVFAGRVIEDIKVEFYSLISSLKERMQILVFDEFCSYDFLGKLCDNADYILMPYQNAAQSSGLLAYATQFKVPVVGPKKGLIGRLIMDYEMGITLESVEAKSISKVLKDLTCCKMNEQKASTYLKDNTVIKFVETIFSGV